MYEYVIDTCSNAEVVAVLCGGSEDSRDRVYADTPTMRAAAANHLAKGCTGLYAHSMRWPLAKPETDFLHELRSGAPVLLAGDKRYVLPRRHPTAAALGYDVSLPLEFTTADPSNARLIPLYLADDPAKPASISLILNVASTVAADTILLLLNGVSLADEPRTHEPRNGARGIDRTAGSYDGLRTTVQLDSRVARAALCHGKNELSICLAARPPGLGGAGGVTIAEIELVVEMTAVAVTATAKL